MLTNIGKDPGMGSPYAEPVRWISIGLLCLSLLVGWRRCRQPLEIHLEAGRPSQPQVYVQGWVRGGWVDSQFNAVESHFEKVRLVKAGYRASQFSRGSQTVLLWPNPVEVWLCFPWLPVSLALVMLTWLRRPPPQLSPAPRLQVSCYEVLHSLGQGAHAEVFLAQADSGLKVALKILKPETSRDPEFRQRFEREAQLCERMDHPRVVRTLGWGEHQGRLWMAQSYLPGQSLASWVKPSGRHPREVRRILKQLAEGLAYAHEMGVFHRDLKPENILLDNKGDVVIADFGLARCLDMKTMTKTDETLGSPAYMAPEQIQGIKMVTGCADLYALGVIGYELAVGQLPFQGDLMQVLVAHLSQPPPRPRTLRPSIPDALEELLLDLLQKDPSHRPPSARNLLVRLGSEEGTGQWANSPPWKISH